MRELDVVIYQAVRGDSNAFTAIVRRFQDMAVGYAFSILGDFHLAEDAAQEAFIEVARSLPQLREYRAFPSWFRKVVFKHCNRLTRGRHLQTVTLDSVNDLASTGSNPADILEKKVMNEMVRESIQSLSDNERQVTTLFYISEYSQKEIAAFLDIPLTTVRKRLHDARRRLRERMMDMVSKSLHEVAPSRDDRFARQVLNSAFPFQVYWIGLDGEEYNNSTLAEREVEIPECHIWMMEPRTTLTDKSLEKFVAECRELRVPGIRSGGNIKTDRQLSAICELDHLTYLDLSGTNMEITDEGLKSLAKLSRLQYLNLNLNQGQNHPKLRPAKVTDKGMAVLHKLPDLIVLKLSNLFNITDRGLAYLQDHQHLKELGLSRTMTGDDTLKMLRGKPNLTHLVTGKQVTDDGLAYLQSFPAFKNDIEEGGYKSSFYVSKGDPSNYLNLDSPYITDKGLVHLAGLNGVHALELPPDHSQYGKWVAHFPVKIDGRPRYTENGLANLCQMANLHRLNAAGEVMTDGAMQVIARSPRLKVLDFGRAAVGDDGFVALSGCQTLERLSGWASNNLTGQGFSALASLPKLAFLYIGGRNLQDDDLKAMSQFSALREFWTGNNNIFTNEAFYHIAKAPNLERLLNMYCRETDDRATEYVTQAKNLKAYGMMGPQVTDRSLELLSKMDRLEEVTMYQLHNTTDTGLEYLAQKRNLRKINITQCKAITVKGVQAFEDQVQVNYQP